MCGSSIYFSGVYFSFIRYPHAFGCRKASRHVPALERRFSSIREFEEFQTNPITHVVQDAAAAETGTEVQRLCIVYAPEVSSARILEILVRMYPIRMRICAYICDPYAHRHVFAARHAYTGCRAMDSSLNSRPVLPRRKLNGEKIISTKNKFFCLHIRVWELRERFCEYRIWNIFLNTKP